MKKVILYILRKLSLHLLFLLFFFLSCNAQQKDLHFEGDHFIIDLDGKIDKYISLSTLFKKNVQTIILETKKECLIGIITELQVFDGCIYVFDQFHAKSLYVFDMNGRFLRKIGAHGRGPGEYIQLEDFTLDTENRFVFLLDIGNRVHKYHFDGTYIGTVNIQIPQSNVQSIQYYSGWLYCDVYGWDSSKTEYHLLGIDPANGNVKFHSIPKKYNKGWNESFSPGHSFFLSRINSPPRYTQLFMDYIISLGDVMTPFVEVKSKNLVKNSDIQKLQGNILEKYNAIQRSAPPKVYDINSLVENDNYILFNCWRGRSPFVVLFHKKKEAVKMGIYWNNDLIYRRGNPLDRFVFYDTNGAFEIMRGDFVESIMNNEVIPNLDKLDQLINLEEEPNPVIFYYEFK